MSNTASNVQTFGLLDLLRPDAARLRRAGRVALGAAIIVLSRFVKHISIGRIVERHARRHPRRVALRFQGRSYTYAEFNAAANRYAHVLKKAGVGSGDVVAVLMTNRPETLLAIVAIVKLGASAAMCNTKQRGDVLAHSLSVVEPAAVLVGEELQQAFEEVRADTPFAGGDRTWFVTDGGQLPASGYRDLAAEAAGQPDDNPPDTTRVDKSSSCFYIFTSGTTGLPKASRMSHMRWLRGGAGLGLAGMGLRPDDVLYCPLPLYHNNALTVSWGSVLVAGGTLALAPKFSVSAFWDDVRHHNATAFCYIGELCRYLLDRPPTDGDRRHAVRTMIGNGLRPDIWDAFKERFGIAHISEFYGASEGNLIFVNGFGLDRTAGFCPLPFAVVAYDPDTEQPMTDAQGKMRRVAKGEVGLLLNKVTSMAPFEGYTDPAATEKKLFHDVFKKGDCWFNTGDLVLNQGMRHIAFVDRLGDTFRWKGENVATTQVENALNAHPQIAESVVYGVQVPGADGRVGMAAITPKNGSEAGDGIDWTGLAKHLTEELPPYAVPLFVRLRPEQEMTGTFKYRKVELKRDGYSPENGDTVYALLPGEGGYRELTAEDRARLDNGDLKL